VPGLTVLVLLFTGLSFASVQPMFYAATAIIRCLIDARQGMLFQ
jgi:hypothetical protein